MALSPKQRSFLRGKAHHLQPVVMIGKEGVSEAVLKTLYSALRSHELVKVKASSADQEEFRATVETILDNCEAEKVQTIGHLLVLFRPSTLPGKVSKALKEAKMPYVRTAEDDEAQEERRAKRAAEEE